MYKKLSPAQWEDILNKAIPRIESGTTVKQMAHELKVNYNTLNRKVLDRVRGKGVRVIPVQLTDEEYEMLAHYGNGSISQGLVNVGRVYKHLKEQNKI